MPKLNSLTVEGVLYDSFHSKTEDLVAQGIATQAYVAEYVRQHGGGGGGGGSDNNAVLTLKNASGWIAKTISVGSACPITFMWSSVEDGLPTGDGVVRISNNGSQKYVSSVEQGTITMDIAPYVAAGDNAVNVSVSDVYGNSKTIAFNITVVSISLTSAFDNTIPYTGAFTYTYTPIGAATKTVHFKVDGEEIATATVTASGRQQSQPIPAQSHGSHTLEVYFVADIGGEKIPSNTLFYELICLEDGNTTKVIASDFTVKTVEQYDSIVIPFRVHDPENLTAAITLNAPDLAEPKPLLVDRTVQRWTYRPDTEGEQVLTITCGDVVKRFALTVTKSQIDVEAETDSLALYLSSYGRSNSEANPGVWESGNISAQFQNFNFASDGWQQDDDGNTVLRVAGDARLYVPYKMFANDFRTTGKTIEFEMATREVLDYDAEVVNCYVDGRGFNITAQQLELASQQSQMGVLYKDDEHIRVSFVVEKRSQNRLLLCYINSIMSGAVQYPADDDFSQANPVGITIGSNKCTTDLYNIRVYDNDLTKYQVLDNWIADTQNLADKKARYNRNDIYDEYGTVVITKLPQDLCYLVLQCPELPKFKGDKKTCNGYFVDLVHPERSFSFTGAEIDVQGTSSQYYYRKNYKIKFKGGFILTDGTKVLVYQMNDQAVPVSTFTMKADVASSEGYYNVVTAKLFNKYHPFKMPAQEADPKTRYSIDGFPIVIFWDNGTETKFLGKYNFNNDKGTSEPFGLSSGDERWEVLQNGTQRVGFHSADFSDDSWKEDFEGNFPDGNTDLTNLRPMCEWVTSTDVDQATGQAIEPVTYGGVEYTNDSAEYRLAKFSAELSEHFVEAAVIYYKVFTDAFLCMDQREKNVLWRYIGELRRWLADYYDADSIIGYNNQAQPVLDYWMEDIDYTVDGKPVFNGQGSTFWKNLEATRSAEIKAEWRRLRDLGFSYETVMAAFEEHKSKWPEAIYNEDMQAKCLDALIESGDGTYLPFLRGDKWAWTQWWMYNRFRYMDSKHDYGTSAENRATIRTNVMANLFLTYYVNMYGNVYYNAEHVALRVEKNIEYEFVSHATGAEDRVIGINDADMITSLGDLSPHMVELIDLSKMVRLQEVKLGDKSAHYVNNSLTSVTFGNNIMLRKVDVRNCVALTQPVDISGCTNIEEVYFDGTSITSLALPNGGVIKKLHLPGTITNLTIRNQTAIADFVLPDYSNITTLRLENVSSAVPVFDILNAIPAGSRVRLIGFDWSFNDAHDIVELCDTLDAMRGLGENGNTLGKAQASGNVRVDNITNYQLASIQDRYPEINVVYKNIVPGLFFYDETGTNLLYVDAVPYGANASYGKKEPTKESTPQHNYFFAGWSKTIGGSVDGSALSNVVADRNVYAIFVETVRTYEVRFWNGNVLLQSVLVPYGENGIYTGATPVPPIAGEGWWFDKWEPKPENITENIDCYAQFGAPIFTKNTDFSLGYGVEWDYSQSATSLTRIGLSHGFSDPVPAVRTDESGASPFDAIMPWSGMKRYNVIDGAIAYSEDDERFSMTGYDTVVYIPPFYYAAYKDEANTKWRWSISPVEKEGYVLHPGSGRYIGRYHTSGNSSAVFSKSGVSPLVRTTRADFRTYSHNKGDNWWMLDIATWSALQLLFLVEFADFNSQNKLGRGYGSDLQSLGSSDAAVYHTYNGGNFTNQYRWIEQPFGRVFDWVDGFVATNRACYLGVDNSTFADATPSLKSAEVTLPSTGYITGLSYCNEFPWVMLPDATSGGSGSTYITDYAESNTGACALRVGGYYIVSDDFGLFCISATFNGTSFTNPAIGSRLIYIP